MSRRRAAEKRKINPDAKYGDFLVAKFISCLMLKGKKSLAEKVVYGSMDLLSSKTKKPALEQFQEVVNAVKPTVEVRSRRVGGATYQVPVEVRSTRAQALALRWLINSARARSEGTMTERLAGEFLDAVNGRGAAVKKREDTHRMAEANRAFSHYRW